MSNLSNDQGRAFEYATMQTLAKEIGKVRKVSVIRNSSYVAAQKAWSAVPIDIKRNLKKSAVEAAQAVFDLEPMTLEDGDDVLELLIQPDQAGKGGDVRDVLIIRKCFQWEIGLSLKHNHLAVKHSRLSNKIDFGYEWFGMKCSDQYWKDIKPIFAMLSAEKGKKTLWRNLPAKGNDVYLPILNAFVAEIKRSYKVYGSIVPLRMVEYLLGKFDFYKVIGQDRLRLTQIQAFNFRGKLNRASPRKKPVIIVPRSKLPDRIISIKVRPDKDNWVELCLNNGWQFGFRIHSASTVVEASLKFDIGIIGMPANILTIDRHWR